MQLTQEKKILRLVWSKHFTEKNFLDLNLVHRYIKKIIPITIIVGPLAKSSVFLPLYLRYTIQQKFYISQWAS